VTYGHHSNGMICSARELGLGEDHTGIIVLPPGAATPGTDARAVLGLDDAVLELEITPDRGYAMSVRGVARELSHAFGVAFHDPGAPAKASWAVAPTEPPYQVEVADPIGCDRFAARVVRGIDPDALSPQWMRTRLALAGVRAISLAVDVTNYVMLELGQPMHAFDLDRLAGPLVVRRATAGETLTTLDGVTRRLDLQDMVICDDTGVISLAAVMGGQTSEVVPGTTNVLLEAAHWDPVMVGRTARRHKLFSEAAKRWERGVDPSLPLVALDRAIALLTRHAGGTMDERLLDIDHVAPMRPVRMAADQPSRVAGVAYRPERVAALLKQVGCAVARKGATLTVTPPTWRPDLTEPADLVEEVIRLDGYDAVPSELPLAPAGNGLTAVQRSRRSVGRALAEAGFVEVLSYPFCAPGVLDVLGLPAGDPRRHAVALTNPISAEEPLLRTTLLPPLLATLRRNVGRGARDVVLFEQGLVFLAAGGSSDGASGGSSGTGDGAGHGAVVGVGGGADAGVGAGAVAGVGAAPALPVDRRPTDAEFAVADAVRPHQPWHVAAVLAGERDPAGWWGPGRAADWSDAVAAATTACAAAGATPVVRAAAYAPWHPGRCAEIIVDGVVVGHAGELHPAVCAGLELPRRICAMEINLDAIAPSAPVPAPAISTFPPALIDVALVVDAGVPAAAVREALVAGAGELLEAVRLFDVFTGAQVGAGRKSLAYKLTFRAPDRTLTVEEAVGARDAAVAVAADRVGATLR
jgi:phenylalanyl-tRNA synthetase beta chain